MAAPDLVVRTKNTSKAFYLAFQRCSECCLLPNGQIEWLPVPAFVCAAFSVEVGFKALAAGGLHRSHGLKELFSKLDSSTQKRIITSVGIQEKEFCSSLEKVSDTFTKWRYIHEQEATCCLDTDFLGKLAKATQDALSP